jgi:hypothetical protein
MGEGGKAKTLTEKKLLKMMNDKNITVNIIAENSGKDNTFKTHDGQTLKYAEGSEGGAYGGNTVSSDGKVETYQYVDPKKLANTDASVGDKVSGGMMLHEFAEGYFGGKIARQKGQGDNAVNPQYYSTAHRRANKISCGTLGPIYRRDDHIDITTGKISSTETLIGHSKRGN